MRTIWKFPLHVTDRQSLTIPRVWRFLDVQEQHGKPVIWVLLDENGPKEKWTVVTVGTGNKVPDDVSGEEYIGTYQQLDGRFIGHVFVCRSTETETRE